MQMVELSSQREKIEQLERDLGAREEVLSQQITDVLHQGKVTSAIYGSEAKPGSDKETLTLAETKARMLKYEKHSINHDLKVGY